MKIIETLKRSATLMEVKCDSGFEESLSIWTKLHNSYNRGSPCNKMCDATEIIEQFTLDTK